MTLANSRLACARDNTLPTAVGSRAQLSSPRYREQLARPQIHGLNIIEDLVERDDIAVLHVDLEQGDLVRGRAAVAHALLWNDDAKVVVERVKARGTYTAARHGPGDDQRVDREIDQLTRSE